MSRFHLLSELGEQRPPLFSFRTEINSLLSSHPLWVVPCSHWPGSCPRALMVGQAWAPDGGLVTAFELSQEVNGEGRLGEQAGGAPSFQGWIRLSSLGGLEGLGRAHTLQPSVHKGACEGSLLPPGGEVGAAGTVSPWLLPDSELTSISFIAGLCLPPVCRF